MHSVSALVEVINDPSSAIMKFHFSSFLGDIVLFFFVLVKFWSLVLLCFYSICYHQAISLPFFLFFLTMNSFGYGICFLWRRKFLYTFFCQLIYFKCNLLCILVFCRSSDDGTCRIWDARYSQFSPRIYVPRPTDSLAG